MADVPCKLGFVVNLQGFLDIIYKKEFIVMETAEPTLKPEGHLS